MKPCAGGRRLWTEEVSSGPGGTWPTQTPPVSSSGTGLQGFAAVWEEIHRQGLPEC